MRKPTSVEVYVLLSILQEIPPLFLIGYVTGLNARAAVLYDIAFLPMWIMWGTSLGSVLVVLLGTLLYAKRARRAGAVLHGGWNLLWLGYNLFLTLTAFGMGTSALGADNVAKFVLVPLLVGRPTDAVVYILNMALAVASLLALEHLYAERRTGLRVLLTRGHARESPVAIKMDHSKGSGGGAVHPRILGSNTIASPEDQRLSLISFHAPPPPLLVVSEATGEGSPRGVINSSHGSLAALQNKPRMRNVNNATGNGSGGGGGSSRPLSMHSMLATMTPGDGTARPLTPDMNLARAAHAAQSPVACSIVVSSGGRTPSIDVDEEPDETDDAILPDAELPQFTGSQLSVYSQASSGMPSGNSIGLGGGGGYNSGSRPLLPFQHHSPQEHSLWMHNASGSGDGAAEGPLLVHGGNQNASRVSVSAAPFSNGSLGRTSPAGTAGPQATQHLAVRGLTGSNASPAARRSWAAPS